MKIALGKIDGGKDDFRYVLGDDENSILIADYHEAPDSMSELVDYPEAEWADLFDRENKSLVLTFSTEREHDTCLDCDNFLYEHRMVWPDFGRLRVTYGGRGDKPLTKDYSKCKMKFTSARNGRISMHTYSLQVVK